METKAYEILSTKDQSSYLNEDFIEFMTEKFFRPLITPLPIVQILKNIKTHQWNPQSVICNQGQKINSYFFLLQGCINVYKKNFLNQKQTRLEIIKNISSPSLISDSFFSQNPHRSHTLVTSDNTQQSKGFSIKREIIDEYCGQLIKQHKILKNYFCTFLNISSDRFYKIDLYENVSFKTYSYGQKIKLRNQILIIYSGECLMSFEEVVENRKKSDSPFKTSTKKSHKYRPLIKLCENECFGMQMMFPPKDQHTYKFKYVVTNEKMVGITIAFDKLVNFPKEINEKISKTREYHIKKMQQSSYYQNLSQLSNSSKSFTQLPKKQKVVIDSQQQNPVKDSNAKTQELNQKILQRSSQSLHTIQKSQFKLPNVKSSGQLPKINEIPNMKKSQSSFKVNQNDAFELKKKFCIGFELKNRCDKQQLKTPRVSPSKQVIKQPKGYFSFTRIKKQQKQNNNRVSIHQIVSPLGKNKDWSCYLKLPKLL